MDAKIKKLLGIGLSGGYGKNNYGKVSRAGFDLESSDYQGDGGHYHDEWAAHRNGGGQELVRTNDGKVWTRVYAGGIPSEDLLISFGTNAKEVGEKIQYFLREAGTKSRFDENFNLDEGDWSYSYKPIVNNKEVDLIVGEENIRYKGKAVFVHYLINSPVI